MPYISPIHPSNGGSTERFRILRRKRLSFSNPELEQKKPIKDTPSSRFQIKPDRLSISPRNQKLLKSTHPKRRPIDSDRISPRMRDSSKKHLGSIINRMLDRNLDNIEKNVNNTDSVPDSKMISSLEQNAKILSKMESRVSRASDRGFIDAESASPHFNKISVIRDKIQAKGGQFFSSKLDDIASNLKNIENLSRDEATETLSNMTQNLSNLEEQIQSGQSNGILSSDASSSLAEKAFNLRQTIEDANTQVQNRSANAEMGTPTTDVPTASEDIANQLAGLEKGLSSIDVRIEKATTSLKTSMAELHGMQAKVTEQFMEGNITETDYDSFIGKIDTMRETIGNINSEIEQRATMETDMAGLEQNVADIDSTAEDALSSMETTSTNLNSMETRINDAFTAGTLNETERDAMLGRVNTARGDIQSKGNTLFSSQLDNINTSLSSVGAMDDTQASELMNTMTEELYALETQVNQAPGSKTLSQSDHTALSERISTMRETIGSINEKIEQRATMETDMAGLEQNVADIDSTAEDALSSMETTSINLNSMETRINDAFTAGTLNETKRDAMLGRVNTARGDIQSKGNTLFSSLLDNISSSLSSAGAMDDTQASELMNTMTEELNSLETKVNQAPGSKTLSQSDHTALSERISTMRETIGSINEEIEQRATMETDMAGLEQNVADIDSAAEDALSSMETTSTNLNSMKTRINDAFTAGTLDETERDAMLSRVATAHFAIQTKGEAFFSSGLQNIASTMRSIYPNTANAETAISDAQSNINTLTAQLQDAESKGLLTTEARTALESQATDMNTTANNKSTLLDIQKNVKQLQTDIQSISNDSNTTEGISQLETLLGQLNTYETQLNDIHTAGSINDLEARIVEIEVNSAHDDLTSKGDLFATREVSGLFGESTSAINQQDWTLARSKLGDARSRVQDLHSRGLMSDFQKTSLETQVTNRSVKLVETVEADLTSKLSDIQNIIDRRDSPRATSTDKLDSLNTAMTDIKATQQSLNDLYFNGFVSSGKRTELQNDIDAKTTTIQDKADNIFTTAISNLSTRITNINNSNASNTSIEDLVEIGTQLDQQLTDIQNASSGSVVDYRKASAFTREARNLKTSLSAITGRKLDTLKNNMSSEVSQSLTQATGGTRSFSTNNARIVNQYLISATNDVNDYETEIDKAFEGGLINEHEKRTYTNATSSKHRDIERHATDDIKNQINASVKAGQMGEAQHTFFSGLIDDLFKAGTIEEGTKTHLISTLDKKMPQ